MLSATFLPPPPLGFYIICSAAAGGSGNSVDSRPTATLWHIRNIMQPVDWPLSINDWLVTGHNLLFHSLCLLADGGSRLST